MLDGFAAAGDAAGGAAYTAAEELVRVLMDFYGAGLARVVAGLDEGRLAALLDDELVGGLLALHDLHPEDARTRIGRVLAASRERVEVLDFDEATGRLRLRAASAPGGGCGCGNGGDGVPQELKDALAGLVPEVTAVELEPVRRDREPALLQIGHRPPAAARQR
ncbi:hypothetical protein GPJ59_33305 [Streptomyces bambusae]|uniref:NifU family protein n=1 Tax=Streptomyces bambusae TaxID=1550616 RepID=A0ABS6ZFR3_9ACTN|nr:hypothetical protein [Streptomyces bambusae]